MNKQTQQAMFSSSSDEWETPEWLFNRLDEVFHFTLDPAASDISHMCENYYTKEQDGLKQSWLGETVFVNPPYTKVGNKSQAEAWCRKAATEWRNTTVMLLPARTDTKLWHEWVFPYATHFIFLKGRLKFGHPNKEQTTSAPFPSVVVVYQGFNYKIHKLNDLGCVLHA